MPRGRAKKINIVTNWKLPKSFVRVQAATVPDATADASSNLEVPLVSLQEVPVQQIVPVPHVSIVADLLLDGATHCDANHGDVFSCADHFYVGATHGDANLFGGVSSCALFYSVGRSLSSYNSPTIQIHA